MNCQNLFSGKNKKISKCYLLKVLHSMLKFLHSMISVKVLLYIVFTIKAPFKIVADNMLISSLPEPIKLIGEIIV